MMNHKVKKTMGICHDGYPFIFVFALVTVFSYVMSCLWVAIPFTVLTLWCIWFFRDPERELPQGDHVLACPADGRVIEVKETSCPYLLEGQMLKVSIFMNIFNVHVNRMPLDADVEATHYLEGKFMGAFKEKASLDNEQMGVLVNHQGVKMLFVQIAGLVARRIICRIEKGEKVHKGQRYGLIRFGSRVDMYLPLDTKIDVNVGDQVWAGKTKIGELMWQD